MANTALIARKGDDLYVCNMVFDELGISSLTKNNVPIAVSHNPLEVKALLDRILTS